MAKSEPQIKGMQLLGAVKLLRTRRAESLPLLDAKLHHYLDERIVVSAWYPEQDHIALLHVVSEFIRPTTTRDPWRIIGEQGAKNDFQGTYSTLLRQGNPEAMLQNMPGIWSLYRDTGRIVVVGSTSTAARIELHDHPPMSNEILQVNAGFFSGLLRLSGAQTPDVAVLPYSQTGNVTVWLASWLLAA